MDHIRLFNVWYTEDQQKTSARIPSACCLSSTGLDGFPNSRFVSLKEVKFGRFIITGPMNSRKGQEIEQDNKVALAFWWPTIERQVRIQGEAFELSLLESKYYFVDREQDAKLVSLISKQGEVLTNEEVLKIKYNEAESQYEAMDVPMPDEWGGWYIVPTRIEFMKFKPSRFHERVLYTKTGEDWTRTLLQP